MELKTCLSVPTLKRYFFSDRTLGRDQFSSVAEKELELIEFLNVKSSLCRITL